ncbi:MAG TPA: hypothetical protein VJN88_00510 [Ktedonobacterales bacterium]|nr:hypothetical protein [Ktedonobacterales bacterium]
MRTREPLYWGLIGGLLGFGLLAINGIGLPFLLLGLALSIVAGARLRSGGLWAALIGFGVVPVAGYLYDILTTPATCSPGQHTHCGHLSSTYYVAPLIFGAIALIGIGWAVMKRRVLRRLIALGDAR